jgi:hypothetical protein
LLLHALRICLHAHRLHRHRHSLAAVDLSNRCRNASPVQQNYDHRQRQRHRTCQSQKRDETDRAVTAIYSRHMLQRTDRIVRYQRHRMTVSARDDAKVNRTAMIDDWTVHPMQWVQRSMIDCHRRDIDM